MKAVIITIIVCLFVYLLCGMILVPMNYRKSRKIQIDNVIKILENVIYEQDIQVIKTKISDSIKILKETDIKKDK